MFRIPMSKQDIDLRKKAYEEQHEFNLKVLRRLENVSSFKGNAGKADIEAGMSLIKERNKFLVLADSFVWDIALCYAKGCLLRTARTSVEYIER